MNRKYSLRCCGLNSGIAYDREGGGGADVACLVGTAFAVRPDPCRLTTLGLKRSKKKVRSLQQWCGGYSTGGFLSPSICFVGGGYFYILDIAKLNAVVHAHVLRSFLDREDRAAHGGRAAHSGSLAMSTPRYSLD